jgi:inward rectifier potassium channel
MPILQRISWYHTMIDMGMWRFMLIIISFYAGINFIFATIYYGIGIEHLDGIASTDRMGKIWTGFIFSAQTFTTVGYGHIVQSVF